MKAMILAAGLGTRLKPWTLEHPKALVPIGGKPMLERVILKLKAQGFDNIVINVHHFADQIVDFINGNDLGVKVSISDETGKLLDTGGGLANASELLLGEPFLVHNVDILSNADLGELMAVHKERGDDVTLLTSGRDSSRKLLFGEKDDLKGWHNLTTGEFRPAETGSLERVEENAFSGIYIVSENGLDALCRFGQERGMDVFPVMDFFLTSIGKLKIRRHYSADLDLIDIGKPETLKRASAFIDGDAHMSGSCCY